MQIGMRIYYEKATGNVILNTGERQGSVIETTLEQDFETYKILSERVPETIGVVQLEYGRFREDFSQASGYRVNPDTEELEFSYPDLEGDPEFPQEPVYRMPLTERITAVESENAGMALELALTQARLDQAEQEQAELILSLVEGGIL